MLESLYVEFAVFHRFSPFDFVMSKVDPASLTPYEQLIFEAGTDESAKKEISEEKRVGFYRLKHKLGSGNFSEVKFGTHLLTKG